MKHNKKGFTLIELLVVIAILAILATVSVLGYTSFIIKAKKSNVITELTQIKTVITTDLIDNNNNKYKYINEQEENKLYIYDLTSEEMTTLNLKEEFKDLKTLKGEIKITSWATGNYGGSSLIDDYEVIEITYVLNEIEGIWNIQTGIIGIK